MAGIQVPQYKREVQAQLTATPYQELKLNEDMFGINVSRAMNNVGKGLGDVGDALIEIKNKYDDTKILEMVNRSSEWEQEHLYDKEKGYYYQFGKDAYGRSEELLKDYDDFMTKHMQNAKLSPAASKRAKDTYLKARERVQQGITSHDFKQGIAWSNTEAETGKTNYINTAVNMRNDDKEISKALLSGYQIIEWQGETQHQDEATIRFQKMQYRSQLHEAVLNAYLGEGSLKASEYLEAHKAEINPQKLSSYVSAVKSNELNYTARNIAAQYVGMPIEQVYASINAIDDPQTRNAVMAQYNVLNNQQEAVQREKVNNFMSDMSNQLADALANGSDANDLKRDILKSDLPLEAKEKQIKFINDCLELNQEVHLWNETEYIENLKRTDHEAFQKLDLSQFALTKSEREKYLKEQNQVIEYNTESQLRDIVKEFDTFFWAGKNGLDSNVYKDELVGMLARIERLQGKAFDIDHLDKNGLQALIEGFGYKSDTVANKNIDETKELYMRAKAVADIQEKVARSYISFKNQNKREPEPEEMFGIVQKIYNDVGRENNAKKQAKVDRMSQMSTNINNAQIKKAGYTKVLTNFEERTIPDLEKETGVKMKITSTYRSSGKYGHEKGLKADVFPQNPTKENIIKSAEYLLASPDVEVVFTSNPYVLARFKGHSKLQDATKYDNSPEAKKGKINHVTHFDIKLTSKFGGTNQMKEAYISAPKPPQISAVR